MTSIRCVIRTVVMILAIGISAEAAPQNTDYDANKLFQEPTYFGQPLTFWLEVIRDRNEEKISLAFDAVRSLGPDGWIAVPDLTRIISASFAPIDLAKDSHESIASKLYDVSVRAEAVDALGAIGESASPAASALIRWALMPRILPGSSRTADDEELFMELVILDAEERLRVAAAIAKLGRSAFPAVAALLSSPEAPRRRLGVAVLNQDALPIAAELLRSDACEDRKLGFAIFKDMDLVVAQPYLDELRKRVCVIRSD